MTIRQLTLPRVDDADTQKALDLVQAEFAKLPTVKLLQGNLLADISVSSSSPYSSVSHGLGYVPHGYIVVKHDQSSAFLVYETADADKTFLYLAGSADVVVSLWVF